MSLALKLRECIRKKVVHLNRSTRHFKTKTIARNKIPTILGQGGFWSPVIETTCSSKQCYTSVVERAQTNGLVLYSSWG